MPVVEAYGPQTPQKNHQTAVMQHGCLTPPITPEGEQFGQTNMVKAQQIQHGYPTTPTPDHSSNTQHQPQYYQNSYLHPQHM